MTDIITTRANNHLYLHKKDETLLFEENLFDPNWLSENNLIFAKAHGRAPVYIFNWQGRQFVLKHYCRGGFPAKLSKDKYFCFDTKLTRVYKEFELLSEMQKLGLPVPNPCFARIAKRNLLYQADIITEYIAGAISLAEILCQTPLEEKMWKKIGETIRQFHKHQIYHADLNANNILLVGEDVFLIDFDQSKIKKGDGWKQATFNRLKRSLLKIQKQHTSFYFDERNWQILLKKP